MVESAVFLQDLAVVAIIAALTSLVFQRLRFPLVFGLLAAGVIIGPHTPPFSLVQDEANLRTLADLGVVLILFGLGLDFNLRSLRRVGFAALAVTLIEVLLMLWLGFEIGLLMGWARLDAIFLGAMLSVSSTAIIVSVLRELGRLDEESSRVVFAVLVLEDIVAILILVLLGGYAATGSLPVGEAMLVGARMVVFLLGGLVVGLLAVPRILGAVAARFRPEVTVLFVVGLALGGAILSDLAGFHVGLGAFIVGAVASEAKLKHVVEDRFRPIHDLFGAIFFVSIGTLVDFSVLAAYWRPVLLVTIVILLGKLLSGALATFLAGYAPKTAIEVGASLAQIGEFSFVIAAVGLATATMSEFLFPVIVGCAALTSFASPLLIRHGPFLGKQLGALMPAPLGTYAAVYTNWMRGLRTSARPGAGPLSTARRRALLSATLVVIVVGGALLGRGAGERWLAAKLGSPEIAVLAFWGAVIVLVLPLVYEMSREVRRWTDLAQETRYPRAVPRIGVRPVVRYTLYVLGLVVLGLPIVVATAPFIEGPTIFIAWAAVVAMAVLFLGRGIVRLHRHVHEQVESLLREENLVVPVPEVVQAVVARGLGGPLDTETIRIDGQAWASGRTLGELQLRTHTGGNILLIHRGDKQLGAGAPIALMPGDEAVVLGSRDQLSAARALLTRPSSGQTHRVQPGQLVVPDGSPVDGCTLAEAGLRSRFGIQIVAIQRGDDVVANPTATEKILAGDVLVVLGSSQSILEAEHFLHGPLKGGAPE